MYDELVKSLRDCAEVNSLSLYKRGLMKQAADAIEKLLSRLQNAINWTSVEKGCKDLCAYLPKWIPVTERLPNGETGRYLVAASLLSYGLWVSICYYADNLEEVDEYDFKDAKHGGFYGYDDEYGYYERSGVKYWMPLPEPPKGE